MYLLSDVVYENAKWYPDAPALLDAERSLTWREFEERVKRFRLRLAQRGVVRGSRVAILDRNSVEYVILHYALASMGATLVPINMWQRRSEVSFVLADSLPLLVVVGDEFRKLAEAALSDETLKSFGYEPDIFGWEELYTQEKPGDDELSELSIPAAESWEDIHLILYTSGTTGRPKGTLISHRRSMLDAFSAIATFGIRFGERYLCYTPLFHTGAWDYLKLYFLQAGAAVIMERFDAPTAVSLIDKYNCNGMFGVPLTLRAIIDDPSFQVTDVSSMRLIMYSSYDPSEVMDKTLRAFRKRGATEIGIAHAYGLTEGGCYVSILRPELAEGRVQSVGKPVPGLQMRLLDGNNIEVPEGKPGEICVRGPTTMSGYLNRPEATEAAFAGGWLHTGDIGQVDDEGFLYVVDRKKDMIRSAGENVYAKEVEQAVISHAGVVDCAVVGLPDPEYEEKVVAVVVKASDAQLSEGELRAYIRTLIAGFKAPKDIFFTDSLPKTAMGKTKKQEVLSALLKRNGDSIGDNAEVPRQF